MDQIIIIIIIIITIKIDGAAHRIQWEKNQHIGVTY